MGTDVNEGMWKMGQMQERKKTDFAKRKKLKKKAVTFKGTVAQEFVEPVEEGMAGRNTLMVKELLMGEGIIRISERNTCMREGISGITEEEHTNGKKTVAGRRNDQDIRKGTHECMKKFLG